MNGIKADPDVKIKMDPDTVTPSGSGYMDDDFFEDTGELSMPAKSVDKDIWMTRVPRWLYEKLSTWDDFADGNDNDEIEIGEIMFIPDSSNLGRASRDNEMRLFLNDKWGAKARLPQAYSLDFMKHKDQEILKSTYVFNEKDLPGYRPSGFGYGQGNRGGFGGIQDPKGRIQKRSKYKKAIPKQTALLGCATREYNCKPLDTKEYVSFRKARTLHAIQGNHTKSNIVTTSEVVNAERPNQLNAAFQNFIKPSTAPKTQLNKAARIPKNELIDMLHVLFDRYAYWPMKAIKSETKQPEAYLKEVLADIAQLVKSGPFASCYMRLPMYSVGKNAAQERPPEDNDDDELDMEDVV